MFDPSHLRSFVALAHELNFNRAARVLNMTQPPLTRHIQALERQLNVALFVRTSRSVQLTPSGRAFLVEVQHIQQQSETALQAARRAAEAPTGRITIGFIGAATYSFLPKLASLAATKLPQISLAFQEMEATQQTEALAVGKIDVGFMRPQPGEKRFLHECTMREPLALALPLSHPLAARRRPSITQINGEPFIMFSPDARYLHGILTALFDRHGIRPAIVQSMSHSQAILSFVSTGMGLAIVPSETRNACFDNVVFRPLAPPGEEIELHALWPRDNRNPALPDFLATARQVFAS